MISRPHVAIVGGGIGGVIRGQCAGRARYPDFRSTSRRPDRRDRGWRVLTPNSVRHLQE